jgi:hypothetical protein
MQNGMKRNIKEVRSKNTRKKGAKMGKILRE